ARVQPVYVVVRESTMKPSLAGELRNGGRAPGQAMVEFALVCVLFLMLVMLIIEGGRLIGSYFGISNAAQDGARAASYGGATDTSGLQAVQRSLEPWVSIPVVISTTPASGCSASNTVCVCRHILPTAAQSASCNTVQEMQRGSVVDVVVNYDFPILPWVAGWAGRTSGVYRVSGYQRIRVE